MPPQYYQHPRYSPDGRRIAVEIRGASSNIWLFDLRQQTLTRLTFDSTAGDPSWTPDGQRVAYVCSGGSEIGIVTADGSAPATSLLRDARFHFLSHEFVSGRGDMIVGTAGGGGADTYQVPADSGGSLRPLLTSPANELEPAISPDGRWLAYVSDETGRREVYVRSYPDMAARYRVSLSGGDEPAWSPKGGELFYRERFYRDQADLLLVATVGAAPMFDVLRRATVLSTADYDYDPWDRAYDIAPDGAHLVFVRRPNDVGDLLLVVHWFDNLRTGRGSADAGRR